MPQDMDVSVMLRDSAIRPSWTVNALGRESTGQSHLESLVFDDPHQIRPQSGPDIADPSGTPGAQPEPVIEEKQPVPKREPAIILLQPHPSLKRVAEQAGLVGQRRVCMGDDRLRGGVPVLFIQPMVKVGAVSVLDIGRQRSDLPIDRGMLVRQHVGKPSSSGFPQPQNIQFHRKRTVHEEQADR